MTLWLRKWKCAICDDYVIFDDEEHTLQCSCAPVENVFVAPDAMRRDFVRLDPIMREVFDKMEELKEQLEKKG